MPRWLPIGKATQTGVAGLSHWLIVSQPKGGCDMRFCRREAVTYVANREDRILILPSSHCPLHINKQAAASSFLRTFPLSTKKSLASPLISSPPCDRCVGRLCQIAPPHCRQDHRIDCPSNHYLHILVIRIVRRYTTKPIITSSSDESSIEK